MQEFLQQDINGLSVGSIYALIAVGYTMVYGILKLINFAHGEVFMVGAMSSVLLASSLGWSWPSSRSVFAGASSVPVPSARSNAMSEAFDARNASSSRLTRPR